MRAIAAFIGTDITLTAFQPIMPTAEVQKQRIPNKKKIELLISSSWEILLTSNSAINVNSNCDFNTIDQLWVVHCSSLKLLISSISNCSCLFKCFIAGPQSGLHCKQLAASMHICLLCSCSGPFLVITRNSNKWRLKLQK